MIEFGPNLDAVDTRRLFTHPDEWAHERNALEALHLYASHVLPGHALARPPNTYEDLVRVDAFKRLAEWHLPLVIESGCLKGWDCSGMVHMNQMYTAIQNVRDAGGDVAAIEFDEPLTGSGFCAGQTIEDAARLTSRAISMLADLHVEAHLIEPHPWIPTARILQFVTRVQALGAPLRRFLWDIDAESFPKLSWWARLLRRPYGLESPAIRRDLQLATARLRTLGLEVGVIVIGQATASQSAYRQSVLRFHDLLKGVWTPADLDVLVVKNWGEQPGNTNASRTMPANFPVEDPTSHLGILETVKGLYA